MIDGEKIYLRALEPTDIEILMKWENNQDIWNISNTIAPFSKFILQEYIKNSHLDIYTTKQYRFVICEKNSLNPVGTIDLFDFDPHNQRVGVGILIDRDFRSKGYATEAISLLSKYCFNVLLVHQIFANIMEDNFESIKIFEKSGFKLIGNKKDWIRTKKGFLNELTYQKIAN